MFMPHKVFVVETHDKRQTPFHKRNRKIRHKKGIV